VLIACTSAIIWERITASERLPDGSFSPDRLHRQFDNEEV